LYFGACTDVFEWNLADKPAIGLRNATASNAAQDTVTDFNMTAYSNIGGVSGGDAIDLRDLLDTEASAAGNIGTLMNFIDVVQVGADTVMRISFNGGFTGGTYNAAVQDQVITFAGVNMFTTYGTATDAGVVQGLLNNGKLLVD
jgi:large repetitive protein